MIRFWRYGSISIMNSTNESPKTDTCQNMSATADTCQKTKIAEYVNALTKPQLIAIRKNPISRAAVKGMPMTYTEGPERDIQLANWDKVLRESCIEYYTTGGRTYDDLCEKTTPKRKEKKRTEEEIKAEAKAEARAEAQAELQAEMDALRAELKVEMDALKALKAKSKVATNSGQGGASRKNLVNSATAIYDRDSKRIHKEKLDGLEEILHTVEFPNLSGGANSKICTSIWHLQYNPTYKTWEVVESSGTELIPPLRENHKSLSAIATAHQVRCYEAGHKEVCRAECTKPIIDPKVLKSLRILGRAVPKVGESWNTYGTVRAGKANPKIAWTFVGMGWGSDASKYFIPDSESESDLEVDDVEEE